MFLAIRNGGIDQFGIFRFLRGGQDEGRIGGGILGLVFPYCRKIPRVTDDGGAGGFQLIERVGHGGWIDEKVWWVWGDY